MNGSNSPWWASALAYVRPLCGQPEDDFQLIAEGHCACFAVRSQSLLVRIGRLGSERQAANAVRFAAAAAPQVRGILPPASWDSPQPLRTPGGPVTFWPLLDVVDRDIDHAWLGDTLRRIHCLPAADVPIKHHPTNPALAGTRLDALRRAPHCDPAVVAECADLMIRIQELRAKVVPGLRTGLVHGDAYAANVVATAAGFHLIDYDTAGVGPLYWDLAPVMVAHRRFGVSRSAVMDLYSAYGTDPRDDPDFWDVVRIREWGAITYLIDKAAVSKAYHAELIARLDSADDAASWRQLSDLPHPTAMLGASR